MAFLSSLLSPHPTAFDELITYELTSERRNVEEALRVSDQAKAGMHHKTACSLNFIVTVRRSFIESQRLDDAHNRTVSRKAGEILRRLIQLTEDLMRTEMPSSPAVEGPAGDSVGPGLESFRSMSDEIAAIARREDGAMDDVVNRMAELLSLRRG